MEMEELERRLENVLKLADIGLRYSVKDETYILQDIQKAAEGTLIRPIKVEDYI